MKCLLLIMAFSMATLRAMDTIDREIIIDYQYYANSALGLSKTLKMPNDNSLVQGYQELSSFLKKESNLSDDITELSQQWYKQIAENEAVKREYKLAKSNQSWKEYKRATVVACAEIIKQKYNMELNFQGKGDQLITQAFMVNKNVKGDEQKKGFIAGMLVLMRIEDYVKKSIKVAGKE